MVLFSIEVLDETTGTAARIYDNEPNTIAIATGAPHYMYWSPDSEHLAFIAATPGELALFLSTASGEGGATWLRGEGPIYMVWTRDGRALLMHQRMELLLMFLDDGSPGPLRSLVGASMGFKAPAVSPDGTRVAYAVEEDEGSSLFMGNISLAGSGVPPLSGARSVLDVGPSSAFLWSPTRDEIAVADTMDATQSLYERLVLLSGDAVSPTPVIDEPFLAFFWSPEGEKIAYIAFDSDRSTFTWKHVHRSGGEPIALAEFSPSSEFLTMLNFFDQYAYSNAFWSPDSSQIVFAGTVSPGDPRRNGGSPDEDKVYVLDVKEGSTP